MKVFKLIFTMFTIYMLGACAANVKAPTDEKALTADQQARKDMAGTYISTVCKIASDHLSQRYELRTPYDTTFNEYTVYLNEFPNNDCSGTASAIVEIVGTSKFGPAEGETDKEFTAEVTLEDGVTVVTGNKFNLTWSGSFVTVTDASFLAAFGLTAEQLGERVDISGFNGGYFPGERTQYGVMYWPTDKVFKTNIYIELAKVETDPNNRTVQKISEQEFTRQE